MHNLLDFFTDILALLPLERLGVAAAEIGWRELFALVLVAILAFSACFKIAVTIQLVWKLLKACLKFLICV